MLRRLGNPDNVVTGDGIFIDGDGKLALRPGQDLTPYVAKAANYTVTTTDFLINYTTAGYTLSLVTAVGIAGRIYVVKNSATVGNVTVDASGSELIDGALTATVAASATLRLMSTNAGWISW
jgi:hypothetical protein